MNCQIRLMDGGIENKDLSALDIMYLLDDRRTAKVSFDLEESRIALYPDGRFQIFGGVVNFPRITEW